MTVAVAPALEARGVMRRLGGVAVVDGVDLSIALTLLAWRRLQVV